MSDKRNAIYSALDAMETDEATAVKDMLKPFLTKLAETASGAVADANTRTAEFEALTALNKTTLEELTALKEKGPEVANQSEDIKSLTEQITALTQANADAVAKVEAAEKQTAKDKMRAVYMDGLNLKPEYKGLLVDSMLANETIIEQAGEVGALVGGIFTKASDHFKGIEDTNSEYLITKAGGKQENFGGGGTVDTDAQAEAGIRKNIASGVSSNVTIKGF